MAETSGTPRRRHAVGLRRTRAIESLQPPLCRIADALEHLVARIPACFYCLDTGYRTDGFCTCPKGFEFWNHTHPNEQLKRPDNG